MIDGSSPDLSENEGEIQISFGATYTLRRNRKLRYVILDVGEEVGSYFASQIFEGGRLGMTGTGMFSDIGEIDGQMTLEQILKGFKESSTGLNENMMKMILEYSRKSPRILRKS